MVSLREQLITSLRVFLFLDAYAPRDLDLNLAINKLKMTEEEYLDESLVCIAIKRWQIHHACQIDIPDLQSYSIAALAGLALQSKGMDDHVYQSFVTKKIEEVSELLQQYLKDSNRKHALIEEAEYLINLN